MALTSGIIIGCLLMILLKVFSVIIDLMNSIASKKLFLGTIANSLFLKRIV